ncbi:MAG: dTDP-4-dehydrorhamnose reductase [Bacteroidales bacterium]|nr:dTDP-4-dehydrorhamnose reductase [Bacteroidales bacterium]
MKILVTGCNGQLGNEFQKIAKFDIEHNWLFTDIDTLNICDENALNIYFKENNVDICINCAAYTAVDKAEDEADKAREINALAVKKIAQVCKSTDSLLIHISTDYVFDGTSIRPYLETDAVSPNSVYGKTKAEGEQNIIASGCSYIIVRTSWLYSSFGNNFVKTMLKLGSDRASVNVVDDQNGNPTWAYDLANAIILLIQRFDSKNVKEIFNYSNEGTIPWSNFAEAIFYIGGKNCEVKPISTKEYGSKANRPAFSALDKTKIREYTGIKIPFWRESLIKCIEEIKNNN